MVQNVQKQHVIFRWLLKTARISVNIAFVGLCVLASLQSYAAPNNITQGVAWLQKQISSTGVLITDSKVSSISQAQCESAKTLLQLVGGNSQVTALIASLESTSQDSQASESIACLHNLRQKLGQVVGNSALRTRVVLEGGYAAYPGFSVGNALDTGWALETQLENQFLTDKSKLLGWLQSNQSANGSFSVNNTANMLSTAIVLRGLKQESSQNTVAASIGEKAATYLIGERSAQGNWANDIALTSLLFEAIHPYTAQDATIASSVETFLLSQQQADGSWADDPYVTAVALRALSLVPVAPLKPTLARLKVKFVDARTASPVPNVQLAAVGISTFTANSNVAGEIELSSLQAGIYQLQASVFGYSTVNFTSTLSPGQTLDLGTLQLIISSNPTTAVISGVVRDQVRNQPIAGAVVAVDGQSVSTSTAADGSYLLNNVNAGTVSVIVSKTGYSSVAGTARAEAGQVFIFSPFLVASTGTGTAAECKLDGKVIDAATQQPLGGVFISLTGSIIRSATTDASGNYSVANLASGLVNVQASKTGYDSVVASTRLACSEIHPTAVDFSPMLYASNQTPPNANTGGLSGIVVDAGTNHPIGNAQLTLKPEIGDTQTIQTQADGRFSFRGLSGATAQLQVQADRYQGVTLQYSVTLLQNLDLGQIRLRAPKVEQLLPDFKVLSVKRATSQTDPQSLRLTGAIEVSVINAGNQASPKNVNVLAFGDVNHNNQFDASTDVMLGKAALTQSLTPSQDATLQISVAGLLPFRDAPIHVIVDPDNQIAEISKANNVWSTAQGILRIFESKTFNPKLKWAWSKSTKYPEYDQVMMSPVVGPLFDSNGDGLINQHDTPFVIFTSFSKSRGYGGGGVIRVLNGATGQEFMSIRDTQNDVSAIGGISLADLDGDGKPEIIAITQNFKVISFRNDGTRWWVSPSLFWYYISETQWAPPTVADLDGDGDPEIVFAKNVIRSSNGTVKWSGSGNINGGNSYIGLSIPVVSDLYAKDQQNVVLGASVYSSSGQLLWEATAGEGFAGVGDFEGLGQPSVVVSGNGFVALYSRDGQLKWRVAVPGGGGGPPTVADADGDGHIDIGVAGGTAYTVFKADGSVLWTAPSKDVSSQKTGSTFFDFDGDGSTEVLYADEEKMRVLKGTTGEVLWSIPNPSGTAFEYPLVVDTDIDGSADFVVVSNNYAFDGVTGVRVFEEENKEWVGTRSIWNQHAYSITNINDDLSVPRNPVPSWKEHNTFRLNKRIDGDPRAVADLTVGYVRFVDRGVGGNSTITVRVGNGGSYKVPTGTKLAFYNTDPALGTPTSATLIGMTSISVDLQPGEYQDVDLMIASSLDSLGSNGKIWIVGDDDGTGKTSIIDFDRSNNFVVIDLSSIAVNLRIDVVANKLVYTETEQAIFTATVNNSGSFAHDAQVRFTVLDTNGKLVEILPLSASVRIASGAEGTASQPWSVAGVLAGPYTIKAELVTEQGLVYGSVTSSFAVQAEAGQVNSAKISTDRLTYNAAQMVQMTSRVANLTTNTLQNGLQAVTTVISATGQTVLNRHEVIDQLAAGAVRQYNYSLAGSSLSPGSYQAKVQLLDVQGGVLAQGTSSFTVATSDVSGIGLVGQLQASPSTALIGKTVALSLSVINKGNTALSNIPVTIRVVDPANGSVLSNATQTITNLAMGASQNFSSSWIAAGVDKQVVVAAASAVVGGREVQLAQANIALQGLPKLQASPMQLVFPHLYVGEASVQQDIIVSSVGNITANAMTLALGGANPAQFVISGKGCAAQTSLTLDATCAATISYHPSSVGQHTAELRIGYANGDDIVITLTAQARPIVFGGSVEAAPSPANAGQSVNLTYSLSNPASISASGQFTLAVMNAEGKTLASWPVSASIGATASRAGSQAYIPPGVSQTLTVVLSQVSGTTSIVLAQSSFTVLKLDIEQALSSSNRVLALVSCGDGEEKDGAEPAKPSGCFTQRTLIIDRELTALGVSHTIVSTEDAFKRAMRSGLYNTYWISGKQDKLHDDLSSEIREAVFAGDGLILDGVHDERNKVLDTAAGIDYRGKLGEPGLTVNVSGPLFEPQTLTAAGRSLKLLPLDGAVQQAAFTGTQTSSSGPAIITHSYGAGHSALFAFDLVGSLQAQAQWQPELAAALRYVLAPQAPAVLTPGSVLAVKTAIANQGAATDVNVTGALPAGAALLGSSPTGVFDASTNAISWGFSLDKEQGQDLLLTLRVPPTAGDYTLQTIVSTVHEGVLNSYGTPLTLPIKVTTASQISDDVVHALKALTLTRKQDQMQRDTLVEKAQSAAARFTQGTAASYETAIHELIQAIDLLGSLSGADTRAIHDGLDQMLKEAQWRWDQMAPH